MLARHLATYLLPNLAQAVASFGTVAVMTRLLSDVEYGRYVLVFATMTFAHYVFLTWTEASASRFFTEAREKGETSSHFRSILRAYGWSALAFAAVACVGLLLYPGDTTIKIALASAFAGVLVRSLLRIGLETRRMALQAGRFAGVDTFHTLATFGLSVLAVAWLGMAEDGIFIAMAIASTFALLIEGPALLAQARGGAIEPERIKTYLAFGAPISFGLIMSLALSSGDRFLIAGYLGEGAVGAYSAGYQVAARILETFFVWAASAAFPLLLNAWEKDGPEGARKAARAGFALRIGIGAPAAVGIALVAQPLCEILIGEGLRAEAARIAPWICIAALLAGLCDYFSDAFMLAKKAMQRAILLIFPMLLNLGLNMLLLPVYGINGAIISTIAAYAVGMLLLAFIGRRYVALPVPFDDIAKVATGCAAMAAIVLALPDWGGVAELLVKAGAGGLAYACVALLLDVAGLKTHLAAWRNRRRQGRSISADTPS
jgi:O-antigen/teichoic acid export membrane protein